MFDRFDCWQYREVDGNCWDYVREFLIEKANIPAEHIPRFGICPTDKKAMTKASRGVAGHFKKSGAVQYAIACHYSGKVLQHVGVVDKGMVRHSGSQRGTVKDSIKFFESQEEKTIYMLHESLWQR